MLSNMICSLIAERRIKTTVAKAKAASPIADKMVTLGKRGSIHARRQAAAFLRHKDAVKKLFEEIAPASASRQGGYTRITKLGPRNSDAAPMAYLEWVDFAVAVGDQDDAAIAPPKGSSEEKTEPDS